MVETDNIDMQFDDERASDWVDALMDQREREVFERELAADPEMAADLERFEQTVQALRRMPQPSAPDDFLQAVQSRIRRRSRGRWFGFDQVRGRFPYEAAFNIVLIGILCALYLSASTSGPETLVKPKFAADTSGALADVLPADAIVAGPEFIDATEDIVTVGVKAASLNEVRRLIAEAAAFQLLDVQTEGTTSTLRVKVIGQRGPPTP